MAGYIGTKAVSLSTTAADVNGNATIDGNLTVGSDVDVTGTVTADGLTVDGNDNAIVVNQTAATTGAIKLGNPNDITQNTGVYFRTTGEGLLQIPASGDIVIKDTTLANRARFSGAGDISFYEDTGTTPKFFWDASAEALGIGTSSPAYKLDLGTVSNGTTVFNVTNGTNSNLRFSVADGVSTILNTGGSGALAFSSGGSTERMRIDASGNLLVGTTTETPTSVAGAVLRNSGIVFSSATSAGSVFNRLSTDGQIVQIRKDNTTVGNIGSDGGAFMYLGTGDTGLRFIDSTVDRIAPYNTSTGAQRDNAIDLGEVAARFDDIYATNGTIQTSDANEKQQIAELTAAEMDAAKAISKLFKTFKWNDSVAEKGDDARIHSGVIAQDVEAAMTAAGLDAGKYAFFISSTWWESTEVIPAVEEVLDEEGNVVTEAQQERTVTHTHETAEEAPEGAVEKNRKGIRYPQLLSFIGAATEQRLASIEARLDALETV